MNCNWPAKRRRKWVTFGIAMGVLYWYIGIWVLLIEQIGIASARCAKSLKSVFNLYQTQQSHKFHSIN